MALEIILAKTAEEKEAIYRFRYSIFIQEQSKYYMQADHEKKMLYDEADENATIFFIQDDNRRIIATVRVIGGPESIFPSYAVELFNLALMDTTFVRNDYAMCDRLMVDPDHRNNKIAEKLHQASFVQEIEWGTKICFCSCEPDVLPMYLHYGWRCYGDPMTVSNDRKIFKLLLVLNDFDYLKKLNSPYLQYLPSEYANGVNYPDVLREKLGISLLALG